MAAGAESSRAIAPRLIAITDFGTLGVRQTLGCLGALTAAALPNTVMVQLRDRTLPTRELVDVGRELAALCRRQAQLLQVNDRLDLALLLDADAVHLGEGSVTTGDARRLVGARLVTRACHDPGAAGAVDADGLLLSPVLAPRKGREALGVEGLERARRALAGATSKTLLFALGGVDAAGAGPCLAAGADGVAAIGATQSETGALDLVRALGIPR